MDQDTILANAYRAVIEDRIHELWAYRTWYRNHVGWLPESQTEDRAELRYLLRIARKARALAAPPVIPTGMSYHDWQSVPA
jgi:hypothetical protein